MGIAFGQVTYGNVGSKERLDFTVIGRAANIAARLADLGKQQGQRIIMTKDSCHDVERSRHLGAFQLRNVSDSVDCYTVA